MLGYHPAIDPYHCSFRILLLLTSMDDTSLEIDRLRILDYYMVFPSHISRIRFPDDLRIWKHRFDDTNPYLAAGDSRNVFDLMRPIQMQTLGVLYSKEVVDVHAFRDGLVRIGVRDLDRRLGRKLEARRADYREVLGFLAALSTRLSLFGEDGLKHRTALMEHRYDTV